MDHGLLGIKYEAARLGGLGDEALARIEKEIAEEVGEAWRSDPSIQRGRDAVRAEHGLPPLGEAPSQTPVGKKRPLWRTLLGG